MKLLFVGGTGLISTACAQAALAAGHELWLLNRGRTAPPLDLAGAGTITADAQDPASIRAALAGPHAVDTFDAVVQWIGFSPDHVADDVETFAGAGQYVYISSASAYQKPPAHYLVREGSTPLDNPYWQYSRDKIASERILADAHEGGFPATIVRPSFTYGLTQIPIPINSWTKPFTIVARMRRGAPVLIPGDGTSLWVNTHNSDFAAGLLGLLGNPAALGRAVHITSDEVLTWNQFHDQLAAAAGVDLSGQVLHVPSDGLVAADPDLLGGLWGDKSHSVVFDNALLKELVPGFEARVSFAEGIRRTVEWFDADPARQLVDDAAERQWDAVAAIYRRALDEAAALAAG
ncbi:MAG: NAD-dependent epimerase/dehydratase family protein [Kineosporiaceae bacterium]